MITHVRAVKFIDFKMLGYSNEKITIEIIPEPWIVSMSTFIIV